MLSGFELYPRWVPLTTISFISNNRALRPVSSLEVGAMPSFSFQSELQKQINFVRFLDSVPAALRCLWNSSILFNKFSLEEHVLILKCFSWAEWFFSWEFLEGVCGPILQILILWVYFIFNWNKQVPPKLYPIPVQNGQSLYPFSDQNDWKSIPFGAAHTDIMAYIREYTTG